MKLKMRHFCQILELRKSGDGGEDGENIGGRNPGRACLYRNGCGRLGAEDHVRTGAKVP